MNLDRKLYFVDSGLNISNFKFYKVGRDKLEIQDVYNSNL